MQSDELATKDPSGPDLALVSTKIPSKVCGIQWKHLKICNSAKLPNTTAIRKKPHGKNSRRIIARRCRRLTAGNGTPCINLSYKRCTCLKLCTERCCGDAQRCWTGSRRLCSGVRNGSASHRAVSSAHSCTDPGRTAGLGALAAQPSQPRAERSPQPSTA